MSGVLPYVMRRILTALPTIAIFTCFVFLLQKLLPGDPILTMAGEDRDPATIAACAANIISTIRCRCNSCAGREMR